MKKEYKPYLDLVKENEYRKQLVRNGFKFIEKTNKLKKIIAYVLIGVGVLTIPFPCGSFALIGLGCVMLGFDKDELKRLYKVWIYKRRAKRNNRIR